VGETYRVGYNPDHRWFYFPLMRRDEALVFRYSIRRRTAARAHRTSPSVDPTTPSGAPPRQKHEARTLAFFDS